MGGIKEEGREGRRKEGWTNGWTEGREERNEDIRHGRLGAMAQVVV
jgi:hypothetical protein